MGTKNTVMKNNIACKKSSAVKKKSIAVREKSIAQKKKSARDKNSCALSAQFCDFFSRLRFWKIIANITKTAKRISQTKNNLAFRFLYTLNAIDLLV